MLILKTWKYFSKQLKTIASNSFIVLSIYENSCIMLDNILCMLFKLKNMTLCGHLMSSAVKRKGESSFCKHEASL